MKRLVIIVIVIVLLAASVSGWALYKKKQKSTLGRMGKKFIRPPKMRISFSRKLKKSDRVMIISSMNAYELFLKIWSSQINFREESYVLFLDRQNRVITYYVAGVGGLNSVIMDKKLILTAALKCAAVGMIIAHNHPSGVNYPSEQDIQITANLNEAAKIVGIDLLDHMIITDEDYYSMADEGILL